jgi:deoxyuridine 5'-triphosphate nucleotidohydrolase
MQEIINGQHLQYNYALDAGYDLLLNLTESSSNSIKFKDYLKSSFSSNLQWHINSGGYLPKLYHNGKLVGEYSNQFELSEFIEVIYNLKVFLLLPPARVSHPELNLSFNNFSNCELVRTSFDFVSPEVTLDPQYNIAGFVYPRSGLGAKHQISIANNVGVVDITYTNNVMVALENRGRDIHLFSNGSRIAQLVLGIILNNGYKLNPLNEDTTRGLKGFASTGV